MRQPPFLNWLLSGTLALLIGCGADTGEGPITDFSDASADAGSDARFVEPDSSADVSAERDVSDRDSAALADVGDDAGVATDSESSLRLINAIAGGPALRVTVDGDSVSSALAFGHATRALSLTAGTHSIGIWAGGGAIEPALLWQDDVTLPEDSAIIAVVAWDDGPEGGVRLVFSGDGPEPPEGQAHLRIVHAMADAPPLTVDLWDDGLVDASSASFGTPEGGPLRLPADEPLLARVQRTDDGRTTVLRVTLDALTAGGTTTLVLAGRCERPTTGGDGPAVLLVSDQDDGVSLLRADPWVALLNASPNAPSLDVFEGRAELSDGAAYGAVTDGFDVSRLADSLALFPADWGLSSDLPPDGRDEPLAVWSTAGLESGQRYLVIVTGLLGADTEAESLQIVALSEDFAPMGATPLARLVHAAPHSPVIDLRLTGPLAWLDLLAEPLLAFGESTAPMGLPLPEGALGVIFGTGDGGDPGNAFTLDIAAGDRLVLVVVNERIDPRRLGLPALLGLVAVDTTRLPWQALLVQPD